MVTVSEYYPIINAGAIESIYKQPNMIPLLAFLLANVTVNSLEYEFLGGLPITGIITLLSSSVVKRQIFEKYLDFEKQLSTLDSGKTSSAYIASTVRAGYDFVMKFMDFVSWYGLALSVTTVGYMIANSYISSGPSIELPNSSEGGESPLHPSIHAKPNHDA
ncbi:MAG TPA: hypothetical protein PLX79_03645 [Candidatus Dojkabacteria bacterium]|nr:hypothetical protein [Candidatus Dojkabacteria bacterium]